MNILIIGGSGLIGSNINKVLSSNLNYNKITATHLSFPCNNTVYYDPLLTAPDYIENTKWNVIINTGALTNVDFCEDNIDLSYRSTVESNKKLLDLAKRDQARFIYISTDYIFDGINGPYYEQDAPNPINIYGKHKLEAERLSITYSNSLIIRVTNVYGDEIRKKNFLARIVNELNVGNTLTIDAAFDQLATPINALDVARAIDVLITDDKVGIYHLSSTDYMSRVQLLQKINQYFNNRVNIIAKSTADLNQRALRPLSAGLIASKFRQEYPNFIFSNIDDYINSINYG